VISDPPSALGAVQVTTAPSLVGDAATARGGLGVPRGVTALEAVEAEPVPTPLVAVTTKV
jgi:hypothetical protein